jgi:hypothetical protein
MRVETGRDFCNKSSCSFIHSRILPRYRTIQRLCADDDPRNEYRRSSYISITGGGSGGARMFFLTDAMENRMHRATAGELMRICGVIEPRDWVITLHTSGYLYRYVFFGLVAIGRFM